MSAHLETKFTKRFGCDHAFACAGMGFVGMRPELAVAVSEAGGIGAIGVGSMPPEELRQTIQRIREATDKPFNINLLSCFDHDAQFQICIEEAVPIVSFHWGHPTVDELRQLHDAKISIWEQVGTIEDARRAVDDGIEVVVAQGHEAGGHNYATLPTMILTPTIVDAVAGEALVLAAGGITDGRGVAAALALGADGVWVGTRMVATEEATVHAEHHRRLLAASAEDSVLSSIFGPEMPDFNPMRVLRNRVVEEYNHRLEEVPTEREGMPIIGETIVHGAPHTMTKFELVLPTSDTTGDFEEMAWLSGQGVGLIHSIEPAGKVVADMMAEAAGILRGFR